MANESAVGSDAPLGTLDAESWRKLRQRLTWQYPHTPATKEPAKTSVTALRRRLAEEAEAVQKFQIANLKSQMMERPRSGRLSATEVGTAHHTFLQLVSLEQAGTLVGLKAEANRLEQEEALTSEEVKELDFGALAAFWRSDFGQKILANAKHVRRELEFTTRFSPEELDGAAARPPELFDEEFVVVQGVADLAVILQEEIWIVDFKTDRLKPAELQDKVKQYEPQLQLYAKALSRIYHRPVTRAYLHFLALKHSVDVNLSK